MVVFHFGEFLFFVSFWRVVLCFVRQDDVLCFILAGCSYLSPFGGVQS